VPPGALKGGGRDTLNGVWERRRKTMLLNKRRGTFFPSNVLCGTSKKDIIGILALANPNSC
jgi:hypothetical protein